MGSPAQVTESGEPIANEEKVRELTDHLVRAFEGFLLAHPDGYVEHLDALMAAHNFHKAIVIDLEGRMVLPPGAVRQMAMLTFEKALKSPQGGTK